MKIELCWPVPGPDPVFLPGEGLAAIREHGFQGVRVDCDSRRPVSADVDMLGRITDAGLDGWALASVWGLNQPKPASLPAAIDQAERFYGDLAVQVPQVKDYEVENEPGGRWTPSECAELVTRVGSAIRAANPQARIWGPGTHREMFDPMTGKLDRWIPFAWPQWIKFFYGTPWYTQFRTALAENGGYLDGQAIHPYHNPEDPEFSGFGTRQREHAAVLAQTGDLPIACTEVGYREDDPRTPRDAIRDLIRRELEIGQALGYVVSILFDHHGVWGLFNEDWTPRPGALAVKAFTDSRQPILT